MRDRGVVVQWVWCTRGMGGGEVGRLLVPARGMGPGAIPSWFYRVFPETTVFD